MESASRSFSCTKIMAYLAAILTVLLTAGCAVFDFAPFREHPPVVAGAIVAADNLNPRSDGLSTSVVVYLYQLKTSAEFSQADFFTLYENGKQTLGPDALIKELTVLPGSTTVLDSIELSAESSHVGVLAAFRDWKNAKWSAVFETPANKTTILNIQLQHSDVSLKKEKRSWLRRARKEANETQDNS